MGIEENYFHIIKVIYNKSTPNIILKSEKLKTFLPRLGIRQGCPLSPLLFTMVLEVPGTAIRDEKEREKKIQVGKEEIKPSMLAGGMVLYIENPKGTITKLLGQSVNLIKS